MTSKKRQQACAQRCVCFSTLQGGQMKWVIPESHLFKLAEPPKEQGAWSLGFVLP